MFWILPLLFLCLMCVVPMALMMLGGARGRWLPFWGREASAGDSESPNPRQILDRRYPSGEITDERYQAMRAELESEETVDGLQVQPRPPGR